MLIDHYNRIQALMSVDPLDKLRVYLSQVILPPMKLAPKAPALPPSGHHSHKNVLSVTPQHYRVLEKMYQIDFASFKKGAKEVLNMHVTQDKLQMLDPENVENVTMPCPPSFQLPAPSPKKPTNLEQLCRWISLFPLDSAQAVMHNVFPQTEDWTFSQVKSDIDEDIFQSYIWSPTATASGVTDGLGSVTVFVQPPWILSPKDFESFVSCDVLRRVDDFAHMDEDDKTYAYTSKERLWAKIWDECQRNGSHYFVLTTYWGWVFGVFTAGRTVGLISHVMSDSQSFPTILESLVYWLLSAMGIKGGWEVPEVAEPFNPSVRNLPVPRPSQRIHAAPSESEFSAHSSARVSQSDVDDLDEQLTVEQYLTQGYSAGALLNVNPFAPPTRYRGESNRGVQNWIPYVRAPSPSLTEGSELSASTIKDYGDHEFENGHWMTQEGGVSMTSQIHYS
ncbi:uncharacterized protein C8Q71DRAFT_734682 [Rhodofomes roseus]|uniref:Uncharacterized protein n=1 Tax=Rhodofomes roseus TaxID=34475 RepID=A0ABQ8KWR9_9APHY|nr:uncharacterized protein C8Q71DRAFT_734682 [Rhodofomes roseus]KAH9842813.1 hypothetical protein C8Q71DRAFT_734682 [Rhodofomes roseus]